MKVWASMSLNEAAGYVRLHPPSWAMPLLIAGVVIVGGAFLALDRVHDRRLQRRIYWSGWIAGGVLAAFGLLFRGWPVTAAVFGLVMFGAVFYAYFFTAYLKIGRRIVAFSGVNSRPDVPADDSKATPPPAAQARDAYFGEVSAAKFWWVFVGLVALLAAGVHLGGWAWQAIAFMAVIVVVSAACGVDDATRRLRMARGQYLQAVVVAVLSIQLWGVPVIVYLLGYLIGKRWPMGYGLRDPVGRHARDLVERSRDDEMPDREEQ
jgi:hypothetical protein